MTVGNVTLGYKKSARERVEGEIRAGTMVGEFLIQGVLAEGGMSTVYAAVHPLIGKKAAIKVISQQLSSDAAAVDSFLQEARDANQIRHPNLVDVFAFGTLPDRRCYFAMEWLEGQALRSRISEGALALGESYEILIQMCDALEAVHDKNIVHLDLKPENVYLVPLRGGRTLVKLLDFGIAKFFERDAVPELERAGERRSSSAGTPDYMSPEQVNGRRVNQCSDAYSLGVMAFEMLLSRRPFLGDNRTAILMDHLETPPPKPSLLWPEIPGVLEAVLVGLLQKNPAERPHLSMVRAVLVELRDSALRIRTVNAVAAESLVPALRIAPPTSRHRTATALIVSAVVLLGGVGWSQLDHHAPHAITPAINTTAPEVSPVPLAAPPSRGLVLPRILAVRVNTAAARFVLDGRLISDGAPSIRIALPDSATHTLLVTAHGHQDYQRQISVEPGDTKELVVTLSRVSRLRQPPAIGESDYIIDSSGRSR